jgi:hypothetical protein
VKVDYAAGSRRRDFYLQSVNRRQRKRKHVHRVQHERGTRTPDLPRPLLPSGNYPKVDNAHIVPRLYQRAWEGESRQVAVHSKLSPGCALKSTKNVGVRGPYYRRTRPKQGTEIDDIEASLAYVENRATPALRAVIAREPWTGERKAALAQLFGLQLIRGPAFFATHEDIQRTVVAEARASSFKPRLLAAVDGDVDRARDQTVDALLSSTNRLMTMLSFASKVAGILSLMRWHILRFDGPLLAYSDHPVVLWPMNVDRTLPFDQPILGPLTMLEIRVPIAPDAAILMNWIDRGDDVGISMRRRVAAELNAFTVGQADREWMHQPGSEPEVGEGIFLPLSRRIDTSYDRAAAEGSTRRAHAHRFNERARKRKWVSELEVIVNL